MKFPVFSLYNRELAETSSLETTPSREESANFRSPGTHYTATDHTALLPASPTGGPKVRIRVPRANVRYRYADPTGLGEEPIRRWRKQDSNLGPSRAGVGRCRGTSQRARAQRFC